MTEFTPYASLAGGLLIGLSAVLLMAGLGRIAGITGIVGHLLPPWRGEVKGRAAFVAGLVAAPLIFTLFHLPLHAVTVAASTPALVVAGLAVGAGTVLGNGCTSGHGVCGLARLSPRSLAATLTFMAVAFVTVFIVRHVI
ncbi:YeeE/YedE family protein [Oryzibacter oryziterrae]|uniref:YeeE/YedE family protein n=1 Tax=Oryzibacter oryziterrae TaxID=2766474 RepID=UPI001F3F894A|nr:YeeE/YedE family protein [Oryzibacter oryziterrae]